MYSSGVENPLNEYYSNATVNQLNNRRRAARHKELLKWDYSHIEDAQAYLKKIGVYNWFRNDEKKYIVDQTSLSFPWFTLKVQNIAKVDSEEVFDLGVWNTHTLVVNGTAAMN